MCDNVLRSCWCDSDIRFKCVSTHDDEMENIVYVKLLRLHSSHIRLEKKKKKPPKNIGKQETERQMASPISFSLGVWRGETIGTPPSAGEQINTRDQAIMLFWKCCVHNRYVIIFHLLAVFNTLIIVSPYWTGRKLFPAQLASNVWKSLFPQPVRVVVRCLCM